ncbi:MAG TPA: hypothetical protein VNU26_16670, partial [Mycobacteriales bacterium]|nr:hypothetical protein [Mycobacteriales bacterium]
VRLPRSGPAAVAAVVLLAAGTTAVIALTGTDDPADDAPPADPSVTAAPAGGGSCPQGDRPPTEGALFLEPSCGPVGTEVTATGSGCADTNLGPDGDDGRLGFYADPTGNFSGAQQTPFDVAPDGSWTVTFTVPEAAPGEHPVEVACDSPAQARGSFLVLDEQTAAGSDREEGVPSDRRTASYAGTLRVTNAADGATSEEQAQIGVSCAEVCNLTGLAFGGHAVVVLTPESGGRFSIDLPAGAGDRCAGAVPHAVTGTVVLTGSTMTLEASSETIETACSDGGRYTEYGQTHRFTGTLVDGEPILD